MSARKIDRMAFIEWLALQPKDRLFAVMNPCRCPIAVFAQEQLGYENARVGKVNWRKNGNRWLGIPWKLPEWATTFVHAWDCTHRNEDRAEVALHIAQRIG